MVLEKIPTFAEVKSWVNANTATSVNGETGDVTVQGTPSGIISMWSGTTSDVPSGWTLCDGTDGTPDLRDKFVAGAGTSYGVGDTGGSDSVTLTEAEMPSHTHPIDHSPTGTSPSSGVDAGFPTDNYQVQTENVGIQSAGGDEAHENRPPFYALAYVMKL